MRHLLAVLVAAISIGFAFPSRAANTWGTDLSDLWVTEGEVGWGANIAHQGEIIFMTFFVYGSDTQAKWYFASGMQSQGGSNAFTFVGELYETTGPFLGSPFFNPGAVSIRQVGTATLNAASISQATLTYSVDGVQVVKVIQRNTFRTNNLAGSYIGALRGTANGCASGNGTFEEAALFTVSHSSNGSIAITATLDNGATCVYSGTYSQSGRMGRILGTSGCSGGAQTSFDAFEIEAGYLGFFARYTANYGGGCMETGRIVAMRRQ